jgi:ethanolamine utilization protein EutQ (cupin superfamily)
MIKIIKNKEGTKREVSPTYIINNLLTKELSSNVSLVEGTSKNHREITKGINNDRIYYILKGKMIILGKENISVEEGDVLFISKGTEYEFEGTFKTIIVNVPAFDPKYDETKIIR